MALRDNLVAYYRLEDETDEKNGKTLTNVGSTPFNPGKIGKGVDGGTSNSTKCLYRDECPMTVDTMRTAFSMNIWVKLNEYEINACYASLEGTGGEGRAVAVIDAITNKRIAFRYFPDSALAMATATYDVDLDLDTWYMVTGVFTTTSVKIYINGSMEQETSFSIGSYSLGAQSSIGVLTQRGEHTNYNISSAMVDEYGVWSRALSGGEVISLYNNGDGITFINKLTLETTLSLSAHEYREAEGEATVSVTLSSSITKSKQQNLSLGVSLGLSSSITIKTNTTRISPQVTLGLSSSIYVHKQRPTALELFKSPLFADANLQRYMRFETTVNTVYDSKTGGVFGSWSSGKSYSTGIVTQCIAAAGGSRITSTTGVDNLLGSVTSISAWVKFNNVNGEQIFFAKYADYSYHLKFGIKNGKLYYYDWRHVYGLGFDALGNTSLAPGIWHHVCFTKNETAGTFYLNGINDGEATANSSVNYFSNVESVIACDVYGWRVYGSYLNANLDELALWGRALTPSEVLYLARGVTSNPISSMALSAGKTDQESFVKTLESTIGISNQINSTKKGVGNVSLSLVPTCDKALKRAISTSLSLSSSSDKGKVWTASFGAGISLSSNPFVNKPEFYTANASLSLSSSMGQENLKYLDIYPAFGPVYLGCVDLATNGGETLEYTGLEGTTLAVINLFDHYGVGSIVNNGKTFNKIISISFGYIQEAFVVDNITTGTNYLTVPAGGNSSKVLKINMYARTKGIGAVASSLSDTISITPVSNRGKIFQCVMPPPPANYCTAASGQTLLDSHWGRTFEKSFIGSSPVEMNITFNNGETTSDVLVFELIGMPLLQSGAADLYAGIKKKIITSVDVSLSLAADASMRKFFNFNKEITLSPYSERSKRQHRVFTSSLSISSETILKPEKVIYPDFGPKFEEYSNTSITGSGQPEQVSVDYTVPEGTNAVIITLETRTPINSISDWEHNGVPIAITVSGQYASGGLSWFVYVMSFVVMNIQAGTNNFSFYANWSGGDSANINFSKYSRVKGLGSVAASTSGELSIATTSHRGKIVQILVPNSDIYYDLLSGQNYRGRLSYFNQVLDKDYRTIEEIDMNVLPTGQNNYTNFLFELAGMPLLPDTALDMYAGDKKDIGKNISISERNLIWHYPLDNVAWESTIVEEVILGNNGTFRTPGGDLYSSCYFMVPGKKGNAIWFDNQGIYATPGYFQVPGLNSIPFPIDFPISFSFYIKYEIGATPSDGTSTIISTSYFEGNPTDNLFEVVFFYSETNLGINFYLCSGDGTNFIYFNSNPSTFLSEGEWHNIVVTFRKDTGEDYSYIQIFIDKELQNGTIGSSGLVSLSAFSQDICIGMNKDKPGELTPSFVLDDVRMYNRELTIEEIEASCNYFDGIATEMPKELSSFWPVSLSGHKDITQIRGFSAEDVILSAEITAELFYNYDVTLSTGLSLSASGEEGLTTKKYYYTGRTSITLSGGERKVGMEITVANLSLGVNNNKYVEKCFSENVSTTAVEIINASAAGGGYTVPYTVPEGTELLIVAMAAWNNDNKAIFYNGVHLTYLDGGGDVGSGLFIHYLVNPPIGTYNLTKDAPYTLYCHSLKNVDTSNPIGGLNKIIAGWSENPPYLETTVSLDNSHSLVLDWVQDQSTGTIVTADTGQIVDWQNGTSAKGFGHRYAEGESPVTFRWTNTGEGWTGCGKILIALEVKGTTMINPIGFTPLASESISNNRVFEGELMIDSSQEKYYSKNLSSTISLSSSANLNTTNIITLNSGFSLGINSIKRTDKNVTTFALLSSSKNNLSRLSFNEDITLSGNGGREINCLGGTIFSIGAGMSVSLNKSLGATLHIGSSQGSFYSLFVNVGISLSSENNNKIEGQADVSLVTVADSSFSLTKILGTGITLSGSENRTVLGVTSTSLSLSPSFSRKIVLHRMFNASLSLTPSIDLIVTESTIFYGYVSLGASKQIAIKKSPIDVFIQISESSSLSRVFGASLGLSAWFREDITTEGLWLRAAMQAIRGNGGNVEITLTPGKSSFIQKTLGAEVFLSSYGGNRIFGEADVSLSLTVESKRLPIKVLEGELVMSSENSKSIKKFLNAVITLTGHKYRNMKEFLSSFFILTGESFRRQRRLFLASITLTSSQEMVRTITLDVTLSLTASNKKGIHHFLYSSFSLTSAIVKYTKKNLVSGMSLISDIIKVIGKKFLSNALILTVSKGIPKIWKFVTLDESQDHKTGDDTVKTDNTGDGTRG